MSARPASLLVIFGATGDLAQRMLLPSLYGLQRDGLLPERLRILCTGRSALSDEAFAQTVSEAVERRVSASERDPAHLAALLARTNASTSFIDSEILAFPANNFGQQEPGSNEEIKGFCLTKYSVGFPLFSKISVKGDDKHPLYRYLTEQSPFPGEVEWNFQKYLVDRSGHVVARYKHGTKPLAQDIVKDVERFLAKS